VHRLVHAARGEKEEDERDPHVIDDPIAPRERAVAGA